MTHSVTPFSLKDAPALIERLLPVQKLSAEAYKEQMAVHGKTLTALGSYWKGRKPLILNKACILGCLLPASDNPRRDLEIFEKLMAMDDESFTVRWKRKFNPKEILRDLYIEDVTHYFEITPKGVLPCSSPIDWKNPEYKDVKVSWRSDLSCIEQRQLQSKMLPDIPYQEWLDEAYRPEEVAESVYDHIWEDVNDALHTDASSFSDLIEQLGIMRFGHRPRIADTFCGSGQIPFEAARLGCDVYASDLNPISCMLTWGCFNVVGGSTSAREQLKKEQALLAKTVREKVDDLGVETDGNGWRAKVFLYCVETRCPQSGWVVPLIPSLVISKSHKAIAKLVPDVKNKRYDIQIVVGASEEEMIAANEGTIGRNSRYDEAHLIHRVEGVTYKTKISTLRGDCKHPDGSIRNQLTPCHKTEFSSSSEDLLKERLYCIQWMRPKQKGKGFQYEFRSVSTQDLQREKIVQDYVSEHLAEWQEKGWVPDMRIEVGGPPRYQGLDLVRARGWIYWHHVFNPRQLLVASLINRYTSSMLKFGFTQALNSNSRLSRWRAADGGGVAVIQSFDTQALNTLFNYGTRASTYAVDLVRLRLKSFPLSSTLSLEIKSHEASALVEKSDVFITDPPYGNAVKYEEILDFFIAWLRKNTQTEFSHWVWDSRRSLAIQGEDENFRQAMVSSYKRMAECMPDNGIQVIMFTHQSGTIWADMSNIVWASGLQVTAAWYVVTETDNMRREGSYVKGTVLLICRKREGHLKTTRDDLAWDLKEEVETQVQELTGLNQRAKGLYRDKNVFEDADLQMAGYAAAMRALTRYAIIDGRDMTEEAIRPRVKGETTFVDNLIQFAVNTANQCLVPQGITKKQWDKLSGVERFYLKMLDLEARGAKKLDNYQNFAKAFKVRDFTILMGNQRANKARLKTAEEFGKTEMGEGSQLYQSVLRAVLYALMELMKDVESDAVVSHLTLNIPNYYGDMTQRELAVELSSYLANRFVNIRPEEASAARILCELVKNQRLG